MSCLAVIDTDAISSASFAALAGNTADDNSGRVKLKWCELLGCN